jgi:phage tail-like protein
MELNRIKQLLPGIFRRSAVPESPMLALLQVMEALHEPSEGVLQKLDAVFDPRRTRADFVPMLAHWVNLQGLLIDRHPRHGRAHRWSAIETGRLRELVASATRLAHWRGTAKGLLMLLEVATGESSFEIDEQVPGPDQRPLPFHFRVKIPKAAARHAPMIEHIIQAEKPAYVTYETAIV